MRYQRGRSVACVGVWLGLMTLGCSPGRLIDTSSTDASGSETDETDPTQGSASTDPSEDSSSNTDPSETTTTATTETSPDSDTVTTFLPDDDVPAQECSAWLQDCPEGEKCVPYSSGNGSWEGEKCVLVLGEGLPGDPCTYDGWLEATDDCGPDSMCLSADISQSGMGSCVGFCAGTPDEPECPEGSACTICGDYCPPLCIPNCNPLLQDCGEGQACYWTNGDFNCIFTTQDIPPGQPCGFVNDCEEGNFCAAAEVFPACDGAACCSPFCDLELGDEQCAAVPGTMCLAFFEQGAAPPGLENVGVCITM